METFAEYAPVETPRRHTDLLGIFMLLCTLNTLGITGLLLYAFLTGALSIGKVGDVMTILRGKVLDVEKPITQQEEELRQRMDEFEQAKREEDARRSRADFAARQTLSQLETLKVEIDRDRAALDADIAKHKKDKDAWQAAQDAALAHANSGDYKQFIVTLSSMEAAQAYSVINYSEAGVGATARTYKFADTEVKDILLRLEPDFRAEILGLFFSETNAVKDPIRGATIAKLLASK